MKDIETPASQKAAVDPAAPPTAPLQSRRDAIQRLMKLGIAVPTATVLINMKVNNAFAEPGS